MYASSLIYLEEWHLRTYQRMNFTSPEEEARFKEAVLENKRAKTTGREKQEEKTSGADHAMNDGAAAESASSSDAAELSIALDVEQSEGQ